MKKFVLLPLLFLLSNCAKDGSNGQMGPAGTPAQNCTVNSVTNGAIISCPDGSSVVVLNGTDGADAPPTAYTVTELINPCGDGPGFDEVLLRLANGNLLAHYAGGGNLQFLALIGQGNYVTTDSSACHFTVDSSGGVVW